MLHIVEKASQIDLATGVGIVAIESDHGGPPFIEAFEELQSPAARRMALEYAQSKGLVPGRINGPVSGPYPINAEGIPLDHVRDDQQQPVPMNHPRMQPKRYRIEVPVCRALL